MSVAKNILFFYGSDTYRVAAAVRAIEARFLSKQDSMADLVKLDLSEVGIESLKQTMLTMPFLVSHRLFILRSPFNAPKAVQEELPKLLAMVSSSTVVVVVHVGTPDKRLGLYKWLQAQSKAQEFALPEPADLAKWVMELAQQRGLAISPVVAKVLASAFTSDTMQLYNEVLKLSAYAKSRGSGQISESDVMELCTLAESPSVFALTDAIRDGNVAKSLMLTRKLVEVEDPLMLAGAIASQVRTLAKLVMCRELGVAGQSQIASVSKLNPYVVKLSLSKASKLSKGVIRESYKELVRFDASAKDGTVAAPVGLSLMVVRLCALFK